MTAWQIAKQWHDDNITQIDFNQALGWYFNNGLVHSTPHVFLMGGEVYWDAESREVRNDAPNAWFVYLAASAGCANPTREFMRIAPRPHQWVLWCRHNSFETRAYDWNKLAKKVRL